MSAPRFLTDEHIALLVAAGLRAAGFDAISVRDAGRAGMSDESHLAWAFVEDRIIVTNDDDFLRLIVSSTHAGVIFCRTHKYSDKGLGQKLRELAQERGRELRGTVTFI